MPAVRSQAASSSGPGPAELTRGESQLQGCEDEAFPLPEPDKITLYGQASPPARAGNLWLHSRAEQGRARLYLVAPSRGVGWERLSPVTRRTARAFPWTLLTFNLGTDLECRTPGAQALRCTPPQKSKAPGGTASCQRGHQGQSCCGEKL